MLNFVVKSGRPYLSDFPEFLVNTVKSPKVTYLVDIGEIFSPHKAVY